MMLPSGNDASVALAIWGGRMLSPTTNNEMKVFVDRMNAEARNLHLFDTSYGNPHGLPNKDNRTTCEDVARLCCACLDIPLFREIVGTKFYKFKYYSKILKRKVPTHWKNTNKLLRRPNFIGIKTGITVTAGPCLASAY
jgi:D-alanyl-D-alanine carboxypeptidase